MGQGCLVLVIAWAVGESLCIGTVGFLILVFSVPQGAYILNEIDSGAAGGKELNISWVIVRNYFA